jgi:hypothetical protein
MGNIFSKIRKSPSVDEIDGPISNFNPVDIQRQDTNVSEYYDRIGSRGLFTEDSGNPILNQTLATCDSALNDSLQSTKKKSPMKLVKLGKCIQMEGKVYWEVQWKSGRKQPFSKYELEESLIESAGPQFDSLKKKIIM